jgi:hypothetical protein
MFNDFCQNSFSAAALKGIAGMDRQKPFGEKNRALGGRDDFGKQC